MALDPLELFPEVPNLYEFGSVHRDMIYDEHRVDAYKRAIAHSVRAGDIVVDVGTGTGLLAFLSLQAGAAHVHAIDRSPIIECARQLAEANGFADRVTFYPMDSRDVDLPGRANVLVSELIGHMVFEEGMVETLFDARERFLREDAKIIPQEVTMYAAPVAERQAYASCVDAWQPVHGIDYSLMRSRAIDNTYVTDVAERDLFSHPQPVFAVDLRTGRASEVHKACCFDVHRSGEVNGVAVWFDAVLAAGVHLSSGPWAKTHWQQCFAPVDSPLRVTQGERIRASLSMRLRRSRQDSFEFRVSLSPVSRDAA